MLSSKKNSRARYGYSWCMIAAFAVSIALLASSCGGSGGGDSHASPGSRVVGQVLVLNAALARMSNGKTAERSASQISGCSAVPTGYTALNGADISISGMTETTKTDPSGCFELTLKTSGVKVFTATKTNTAGGTTTLKKAVTIGQNTDLTFVTSDAMTELTTIAAIIVEQKMANNESGINPEATETYVASIQDQEDIQSLLDSVKAAADPNDTSVASFDAIDTSVITVSEQTTDQPVIYSAAITGSPVAQTGGSISVTAKIAAYGSGVSISSANTTLAANGASSITIPMTLSSGITYSGSYTFPVNDTGATISYSATINTVDSNSITGTYSTSTFTVSHIGAYCGDSNIDTANGENCDEGSGNATTCTPGASVGRVANAAPVGPSEQCSYCDNTTCQVISVSWECGDNTLQTSIGEECDDGNILTEACTYGQTSCEVCRADCETVSGATSYCGDGTLHSSDGEQCDEGGSNTNTACTPPGAGVGRIAAAPAPSAQPSSCDYCNTSCQTVTVNTNCGDGILRADLFEQCDDSGESATCDTDCTSVSCGDGTTNQSAGETCDDSGESATCDTDCTAVVCGDGVLNTTAGEQCDDGNTTDFDGCTPTCQVPQLVLKSSIESQVEDASLGKSDMTTGDIDGDGKLEFLIGDDTNSGGIWLFDDDWTYLSRMDGEADATYDAASFSRKIVTADLDGDGSAEIVVSDSSASKNASGLSEGAVYVYDSDGTTLIKKYQGATEDTHMGSGLAAGDIDGDGNDEIIIGAPGTAYGGEAAGSVYIYNNNTTTLIKRIDGPAGEEIGQSVATADLDGDGSPEIIVGTNSNKVYVYEGDGTTLINTIDIGTTGTGFGYKVASAGDVDNDGNDEILIAAIYADFGGSNSGSVYLYDNDASTLLVRIDGSYFSENFGSSISCAGDVDGNGIDDILIGTYNGYIGSNKVGLVFVFKYSAGEAILLGRANGNVGNSEKFARTVTTAGDMDGDGKAEIIVSAPDTDTDNGGISSAGKLFFYELD